MENIARMEWLHLSIEECFAAASLCRPGVELVKELNKIVNDDRYKAVTVFFAGFHSKVTMIKSKTNIVLNFLSCIGNLRSENTIQQLYKHVMNRSFHESILSYVVNFTICTAFLSSSTFKLKLNQIKLLLDIIKILLKSED